MKNSYFTICELVLVCICTAIIASLTIAAVDAADDSAKIAACAKVMAGIEKKLTAWENDHDGRIIFAHNKGVYWGKQLALNGYFDGDGFFDKSKRCPKNFECPSETRARDNDGKGTIQHASPWKSNSYDYGLNFHVHHKPTPQKPLAWKRSELKNPSIQIRMAEGTKYALTIIPTNKTARHGEGASNVLYADGHVAFDDMFPYRGTRGYDTVSWFN